MLYPFLPAGQGEAVSAKPPMRKSAEGSRVVESYCSACGVFIAASTRVVLLDLAEKFHRCAVASWSAGPKHLQVTEAQVVRCLFEAPAMRFEARLDERLEQLLRDLARRRPALQQWLESADGNAQWFRQDPIAAVRAAGLGIPDEMLKELESVTVIITAKLRASR